MSQKNISPKAYKALRIARLVGNIVFYTLITLIIVAGIVGIVGKYKGNGTSIGLFGFNFYVVTTGSMATVNPEYADFLEGHDDQIQAEDLIVTRKIKQGEQLHLYDTVTFTNRSGDIVVHRVVDIQEVNGTVWYTTRGDANNATDGQRTIDEFKGIVVDNAGHGWGQIVKFVQSYYGIAAIAGAIAIILLSILVNDYLAKKGPKPKEPDEVLDEPQEGPPQEQNEENNTEASQEEPTEDKPQQETADTNPE